MTLIFEGKTKQLFSLHDEDTILIKFRDNCCDRASDESSFIKVKEIIANKLNKELFFIIDSIVPNHIIEYKEDETFLAKKVDIIPLKVVVRNFAAGTICARRGYNKGEWFPYPLIEYFLKNGDAILPEVSEAQIEQSGMMNYEAIDKIIELSHLTNKMLREYFLKYNLHLVDVELEFGVDKEGNIILADEISPYTIRVAKHGAQANYWDKDDFKNACSSDLIDHYSNLVNIIGL